MARLPRSARVSASRLSVGATIYSCLDAKLVRLDGDPILPKGSATCNLVAVKVSEPASLEFKPDVGIRGQETVISGLGEELSSE